MQIRKWAVVAVYGLEGFEHVLNIAECLFLLLLRQPWATSPQRLLLGEFLATPNQAELNMFGGACLSL